MIEEGRATEMGIDVLVRELERRYVFDAQGRIAGLRSEGIPPRFVLGRAAEGCLWRFRVDLPPSLVRDVARLAGREPGFPIGAEGPIPPPERLVMIERLFHANGMPHDAGTADDPAKPSERAPAARRQAVTRDGVTVAELFTID